VLVARRNGKATILVGYVVPAEAVEGAEIEVASDAAVLNSLKSRNAQTAPVRDYLQDK